MGAGATVTLKPTTTYGVRHATVVVVKRNPIIGVLEIIERRSAKAKTVIRSRYAIREDRINGGKDRMFCLSKGITGNVQGERYYVCLAAADHWHQCECMGFESHGTCKHIEAMAAVLETGILKKGEKPTE